MGSTATLGDVRARLTADTASFDANMAKSGEVATATSRAIEKASERARAAWEKELVAQDRAMKKSEDAARAKQLSALRADILARSVEAEAVAVERAGHAAVTQMTATSAAVRSLEGNPGIRAVERFLTTIPGVGKALMAAFPLIGGIAFGAMVVELGAKVAEFIKETKEMPERLRDGFRDLHDSAQMANDELRLTNANLDNQLAKLQGKPENNLKVALYETWVEADKLVKRLNDGTKGVKDLLEQNKIGLVGQSLASINPSFGGESTAAVAGMVNYYNKNIADKGYDLKEATRSGDVAGATKAKQDMDNLRVSFLRDIDKEVAKRKGTVSVPGSPNASYGSVYGNPEGNLNILRGQRDILGDQMETKPLEDAGASTQKQIEAEEKKKEAAEAAKRAASEARRAREEEYRAQMGNFEQQLAGIRQEHQLQIGEEEMFWRRMRSTTERESLAWLDINKRIGVAHQQALRELAARSKEEQAELVRAQEGQGRGAESMRREAVKSAGVTNQDYIDNNQAAIQSAQNQAREEEAAATDKAGHSVTRYATALEMAQIHAREFAQEMQALQGILSTRNTQYGLDPTKENARALAEAQAAIAKAQSSRTIQAGNDDDAIYGRSSSGLVGAKDALNEFVRSTSDAAATMGQLTSSTLTDFNRTLTSVLTTSRREGGPHFVRNQFESLGRGVATNVAGTALSKGEGLLFSALGVGGKTKPTGTSGDPLYVKNVGMTAGFGGDLSFLNAGMKLPDVSSTGSALSTAFGNSTGMTVSSLAKSALSLLPAFAEGGAIGAGTMSIIGERGPELFMPSTSGSIIPNNKLPSIGGHTFSVSVDARGAGDPAQVEAAAHRAVMSAAPHIVAAAMRGTKEEGMRSPMSKR